MTDATLIASLVLKMLLTASFVVGASVTAQRAGPLIGAMVATLPISAGPVYIFLALDHSDAFIAQSALASFVANADNAVFALTYAAIAQRRGTFVSLTGALALWALVWFALQAAEWTLARAALPIFGLIAVCILLSRRLRDAPMPRVVRRWYDLPLRGALVAVLVSGVVALSASLGPVVTGMLAVFPIILSSLALILQPRVGGRASGAVIANATSGLMGFGIALAALHLAAVPLGAPLAFTLALAISIGWNLMVIAARRRGFAL